MASVYTSSDEDDSIIYFVSAKDKVLLRQQFQSGAELFQQKEYKNTLDLLDKCIRQVNTCECDRSDEESLHSVSSIVEKDIIELMGKIFITRGLCYFNSTVAGSSSVEERELYFRKAMKDFGAVSRHYQLYKKLFYSDSGYEYLLLKDGAALNLFLSGMKAYFLEGRCLQQLKGQIINGLPSMERATICFSEAIHLAEYLKTNLSYANEKTCQTALEQVPQYYLNRGLSHNDMNSFKAAENDFSDYINLTTKNELLSNEKKTVQLMLAHHNRGIACSSSGKLEEAIHDFNTSIELYESIPLDLTEKKNNFVNSIETHLQRAKAIHKFAQEKIYECKDKSQNELIEKILKLKDVAFEDFKLILSNTKSSENSYNHHYNITQLFNLIATNLNGIVPSEVVEKCFLQSIPHLKECIKQLPNYYKSYIDLAKALYKTSSDHSEEEIMELYNKALTLLQGEAAKKLSNQQYANIYFERGVLNNKMERFEQAISDFTSAIEIFSDFSDAFFNRALLYHKKANVIMAVTDLESVITINPRDVQAIMELAIILSSQGQVGEAKKKLQQVIDIEPNNETAKKCIQSLEENSLINQEFSIREDHTEEEQFIIRKKQRASSDNFGFKLFKRKPKEEIDPSLMDIQESMNRIIKTDNALFVDSSFPATSSSILGSGSRADFELPPHIVNLDTDLVWLRPSQIAGVTSPSLFVNGSNYKDVIQGSLGNCWMLSAMAIVASYNFVMEKVIISTKTNPAIGKYTFCLYKEGNFREITIDDLIPCDARTRSYIFSRSTDPNELWVPLLEKAYAALYGNYYSLKGGHLRDSLVDLTGGISFTHDVDPKQVEKLWEYLSCLPKQSNNSKSIKLMGARSETSASDYTGIVNFHAYAILDAIELPPQLTNGQRVRLIKMKNPWANGIEWKGEWSDYCPRWSPELRHYVGDDFSVNDGIFYMSLEYFALQWNMIEGVELFSTGMWTEFSSQGRFDTNIRSDNNWMLDVLEENQYYIENLTEANRVIISLTQLDTRYAYDSKNEDSCIAIHLIRVETPIKGTQTRLTKINKKDIIVQGDYKYDREVAVEIYLPVGCYVAIPHEYFTTNCKDAELGAYTLRVVSDRKVITTELKP